MVSFITIPYALHGVTILRIPDEISATFTSRSQVMLTGMIGNMSFHGPAEPDGMGGHWVDVTDLSYIAEQPIEVSIEQTNDWPEPTMPAEFMQMLESSPTAKATWDNATPMAHWEWLRWTNATKNSETFAKHIRVSQSKLEKGMRRPCCFNRSSCTVAAVAKSGVLINLADGVK